MVAFFFFLGNFGGEELVFVAKYWWEVVVTCEGLLERETKRKKMREKNIKFILIV